VSISFLTVPETFVEVRPCVCSGALARRCAAVVCISHAHKGWYTASNRLTALTAAFGPATRPGSHPGAATDRRGGRRRARAWRRRRRQRQRRGGPAARAGRRRAARCRCVRGRGRALRPGRAGAARPQYAAWPDAAVAAGVPLSAQGPAACGGVAADDVMIRTAAWAL